MSPDERGNAGAASKTMSTWRIMEDYVLPVLAVAGATLDEIVYVNS